jgi:hypothetical protein
VAKLQFFYIVRVPRKKNWTYLFTGIRYALFFTEDLINMPSYLKDWHLWPARVTLSITLTFI